MHIIRVSASMSSGNRSSKADKPSRQAQQEELAETVNIEFVPLGEKTPRGKARYRDPANPFNTWGGRGKRPKWLCNYLESGRNLNEFEVHDETEE
jgi:DNA-binding protein H-NS